MSFPLTEWRSGRLCTFRAPIICVPATKLEVGFIIADPRTGKLQSEFVQISAIHRVYSHIISLSFSGIETDEQSSCWIDCESRQLVSRQSIVDCLELQREPELMGA